ncbi:MAG: hypothetical protein P8J87_21690, partial [Verrucomicrobiales bacterium]|nr:hypothetical protein [Verrucomicrobiales bacterium]
KISLWLVGDGALDQQDGSWHHAVATIDPTGHKLYVDGELVASNTNPGSLGDSSLAMQIGGNPQAANRGWDGSIDDVGVWDRALTADEVASIWNDGAGTSIETLLNVSPPTFPLTVTRDGDGIELAWPSKEGMLYNLRSSPDLTGEFSTWDLVEADIAATPDTNTKTISNPPGPALFYRVGEFPKPQLPVYSENFDTGVTAPDLPTGWTTGTNAGDTGTTQWQLGIPTSPGPPAANSAPNCIGTNLGAKYGISSKIWIRSSGTIDLTNATAATLTFRQWIDMDDFDTNDSGTVRILDADGLPGNVTELAVLKTDIQGLNPAGWSDFSAIIPTKALGKMVALEFQFGSDNVSVGDASGWHIDDIAVTTSTP